jgi:ferredoxin-NADP reductase/nitrite reductase/ring-hydroxylating ferredoxin subunit
MTSESDTSRWHPIASVTDLPYRHIYRGHLLGHELAVWRADDDFINVWHDRCLHRGLRLSIGTNDGAELLCRYHGWRYASRTAGCTYIPAHPADAPARSICNRTYPVVERYGLIWSTLGADGAPPRVENLERGAPLALRGVEFLAPAELVRQRLVDHTFWPEGATGAAGEAMTIQYLDEAVVLTSEERGIRHTVVFFVQPISDRRCCVRGVLCDPPEPAKTIAALRLHDQALTRLRGAVEAEVAELPEVSIPPETSNDDPVAAASAVGVSIGRSAPTPLDVRVAHKWQVGEDSIAVELTPVSGQLPTAQPGAHIDVHLPNGLVRQYSLINGPGELGSYTIGVKREPASRGGSAYVHDVLQEGDTLAIDGPRNSFPLRRDAVRTVLVAGGIGITPLLSMARCLHHSGSPFELHYFAQSRGHLAFPDLLRGLGRSCTMHLNLSREETVANLDSVIGSHGTANHLYLCGPPGMLDSARAIAVNSGWPDEAVHFEYFANTTDLDQSSAFEIALARSAMTLDVLPGRTVLETLRSSGIELPSSCEQGSCGTCAVTVLDGEPDHRDVFLNATERERGDRMLSCVSRALSDRLVLDI